MAKQPRATEATHTRPIPASAAAVAEPEPTAPTVDVPPPDPQPVVVRDPWWEVQGGMLPKMDVQAPNAEAAIWIYKQRLRVTRVEPTAKRVA